MKVIVSNILDSRTIKVYLLKKKKHKKYGKYLLIKKEFLVSCSEGDNFFIGQEVFVTNSRPVSKQKKWSIV